MQRHYPTKSGMLRAPNFVECRRQSWLNDQCARPLPIGAIGTIDNGLRYDWGRVIHPYQFALIRIGIVTLFVSHKNRNEFFVIKISILKVMSGGGDGIRTHETI